MGGGEELLGIIPYKEVRADADRQSNPKTVQLPLDSPGSGQENVQNLVMAERNNQQNETSTDGKWQMTEVCAPSLKAPVSVIASKDHPAKLLEGRPNRLNKINIYLPLNDQTKDLPRCHGDFFIPKSPESYTLIYLHGGAWRDPTVDFTAVEATAACMFGEHTSPASRISIIASINYSLSSHPTHPTAPYDPAKGDTGDEAREARHPTHVLDVIHALRYLHDIAAVDDHKYILVGHSAGATLACQSTFVPPGYWSSHESKLAVPIPAAIVGLNGLFDLPRLIHEPGTHAHLKDVYTAIVRNAFGDDEEVWRKVSPALFDIKMLVSRLLERKMPELVVLAQSKEDQLVPMNQTESIEAALEHTQVDGSGKTNLSLKRSTKITGQHDDCWKEGREIADMVKYVLTLL